MTLETLIPYAETCHVRDSAVWKVPEGIAVRWVNMGDGNVDIDGWIRKFIQAKPGLPIIFENLVSARPADPCDLRSEVLGQLAEDAGVGIQPLSRARREGHAEAGAPLPEGKTAGQQRIEDLEACVRYTRELLRRDLTNRKLSSAMSSRGYRSLSRLSGCIVRFEVKPKNVNQAL